MAEKISAMVGTCQVMDEKTGPRPAEYRDFMLLVRGRTWLASYERKLRAARIPYLSSRQGGLLDTLECSDLVALLEFLVTPFADLKLAQVLRSPIFGCSDADLMRLVSPLRSGFRCVRGDMGRVQAGGSACASWMERSLSPSLQQARSRLQSWQALADRLPVHDLLDRIYFEGEVLARYRSAVPEAMTGAVQANLHAFIELALNMDSGRYPSLARFINEVAALRRAPGQESPDEGLIGDGGNAVRILTVHGAKGLEAPIVWLLDANTAPRNDGGYRVLLDWPPQAPAPQYFALLSHKAEQARAHERHVNEELEHARRENLNLLYVAMTRARQMFIVSGCAEQGRQRRGTSISIVVWRRPAWERAAAGSFRPTELPAMPPVQEEARLEPLPVPPTGRREIGQAGCRAALRYPAARPAGMGAPGPAAGRAGGKLAGQAGLEHEAFAPLWQSALDVLAGAGTATFLRSGPVPGGLQRTRLSGRGRRTAAPRPPGRICR